MIARTETKTTKTGREYLVRAWVRTSRHQLRGLIRDLRTARTALAIATAKGDKTAIRSQGVACKGLAKEIKAGRKGRVLAAQGLLAALQAGMYVTKGERGYLWAIVRGLAISQGLQEGELLSLALKAA